MELKKISQGSVPAALDMVERYRELNEPMDAESICRDILVVDPDNQEARKMLLLSLTDQFATDISTYDQAQEAAKGLENEYQRLYYTAIIYERRARAHFRKGSPGCGYVAYEWFQRALDGFQQAEAIRPEGNDKALFRWNAIIRTMETHPAIQPEPDNAEPQLLE